MKDAEAQDQKRIMAGQQREPKTVGIVVPAFNEEQVIAQFHQLLRQAIDGRPYQVRIYYIDDGSTDATREALRTVAASDPRVVIVELSRNFGHQAALAAGLSLAEGEAVITMDADGQHPPALIPEMLQLFASGYDVVLTQRLEPGQPSLLKRWTSSAFYWLVNLISNTKMVPGAADFRLVSRQVADVLKDMKEYHRFLRGMVSWVGFRTVVVPYVAEERLGGRSKYTIGKMVKLAVDAMFSFSLVPLRLGLSLGILFLLLACAEVVYVMSFWLSGRQDTLAPGWSSLMFMILIVGGVIMISLGLVGAYVGYIFQEVKGRPVYVIRQIERVQHTEPDRPPG